MAGLWSILICLQIATGKGYFFEENGKWIYKHVEVDFDGAIPINYKI